MGVDIQNKLRVVLGSVKDRASMGKAMIYNNNNGFSGIEVAVVRATGHDKSPIDDKHMHEILFLISNSPAGSVPFLAERISHRLDKTRDRDVALKTLLLVHRLLRGGDRYVEQDLRDAHLSGHLHINTRWFPRDKSDHSLSFLHNYAAFLQERMGWLINQAGKLDPVMFQQVTEFRFFQDKSLDMVFRRLPKCQLFLDRVLDCLPLHISPSDALTRAAMINILKESFHVYATFYEGVVTLVDSFFDFNNPARVLALDLLKRASRQSYDLFNFFENCKRIMGSKNLDYPTVQIITGDTVLAMEQFSSSSPTTFRNDCISAKTSLSPFRIFDDHSRSTVIRATTAVPKIGEEATKEKNGTTSSTLFSCRLETRINKVWVVFDEEEPQNSYFSVRGIGHHSSSIANDPSAEQRVVGRMHG